MIWNNGVPALPETVLRFFYFNALEEGIVN